MPSRLTLSPRGIERSADGRSAEGGVRSELEPLRAEPRSAVARAGANVPPRTFHELPPRVLTSLNIYLSSFPNHCLSRRGTTSLEEIKLYSPLYLPRRLTYALLALRLNAISPQQNPPKIPLESCFLFPKHERNTIRIYSHLHN